MSSPPPHQIHSISEYHQLVQLPAPAHPLLSVIRFEDVRWAAGGPARSLMCDFYSIALKRNVATRMKYGQQTYDLGAGLLTFLAPDQVFRLEEAGDEAHDQAGWLLLVHPDFLWKTPLATAIRQYDYFEYAVNEALFLSGAEEVTLQALLEQMDRETRSATDRFSDSVLLAQLDLLLRYAERFYHRQFLTRHVTNHHLLADLEHLLAAGFTSEALLRQGPPTVQAVADSLCVSPNYLSGVLRVLTGQSTQQHIQARLLEKAKQQLSTTNLSVSEIAFALGFEHSQSFSKFFKGKTDLSPRAFRQSFR